MLASCDAFDNVPPGLTGKTLVLADKLPPAMFGLFMQQMRLRAVRRLPIAFVLTQLEIRQRRRVLRAAAKEPKLLREAAGCLPGFNRPALVVRASEDRVMPPEHGRRPAKLLPQGQLAKIEDTLIPLDQPARLARVVREFTHWINPASKVGQVAAVKVLARELAGEAARRDIPVNAACLGRVDTGASRPWFDDMSGALSPDEAAADVLWLATLPIGAREPYGGFVQHRNVLPLTPMA